MGGVNLGTLKYIEFNSLIGEIGVVWDNKTKLIKQVLLPDLKTRKQNYSKIRFNGVITETEPDEFVYQFMSDIKNIVMGKDITFDLNKLDLNDLTPFQRNVLIQQSKIPHAKVTTYKKLAQLAGKPKSARPVANVLSNNIFPLVIPCHRTVKSDWTIGGYAGSKHSYFKQFILQNEGVIIKKGVISKQYQYPKEELDFEKKYL